MRINLKYCEEHKIKPSTSYGMKNRLKPQLSMNLIKGKNIFRT